MMVTLLATIAVGFAATPQDEPPPPAREFRAVWVATVANIDWPSKPGLPSLDAQRELLAILDQAKGLRLNAVILQVRPTADALYASRHEPWSEYLTGQQGQPPAPLWDPVEFATAEAHRRGMELHVWINPYRARHPTSKSVIHRAHVSRTKPHIVRTYGNHLWMDPGEKETQDHSMAVINDLVARYDIDGIHYDDYFYPYKERDAKGNLIPFPDDQSYAAYRSRGGRLSRDDWRRNNVDTFVQRIYREVKRAKPWVKVGISPFGIYRPNIPEGIAAGVDQYADLYADARKWLVEGWCDYFTPQLYWPIAQTKQSYPVLLKWWLQNNPKGRHLWVGNFTSQVGSQFGNWAPEEIVNQIKVTRELGAGGNVHFSMRAFTGNFKGLNDLLRGGVYASHAVVPASPWIPSRKPAAKPAIQVEQTTPTGDAILRLQRPADGSQNYLIYTRRAGSWMLRDLLGVAATDYAIAGADVRSGVDAVAVSTVDRAGNESPRAVLVLRK